MQLTRYFQRFGVSVKRVGVLVMIERTLLRVPVLSTQYDILERQRPERGCILVAP